MKLAQSGIERLRRVVLRDGAALSDGQLLECYANRQDDAAFAALVRRHGPMVWGVCRRVLGNVHDAEDAFQATFLVLVRKASTVMPRDLIANWLYGVAYHTSIKARTLSTRRRGRERQVRVMPESTSPERELWLDLQPILDRELHALPEKYRSAIVLCDLHGRSYKEAARHLGCPEGTLSARLARGRALLAKRLMRHGVTISGAALAALVSQQGASAGVPATATTATLHAAGLLAAGHATIGISANVLQLTEGVMKTMLLKKLKLTAVALTMIGLLGLGARAWILPASHAEPPAAKPDAPAVAKTDAERIQGAWLMLAMSSSGWAVAPADVKQEGKRWTFHGDKFLVTRTSEPGRVIGATFMLDPTKPLKSLDYTATDGDNKGTTTLAIYKFVDDLLIVVDDQSTKQRPGSFQTEAGRSGRIMVFGREGQTSQLPDDEFLKRVCQDFRSAPPTNLEGRYFKADADAAKRAKAIVWLLGAAHSDPRAQFRTSVFETANELAARRLSANSFFGQNLDRSALLDYSNRININNYEQLFRQQLEPNPLFVDPLNSDGLAASIWLNSLHTQVSAKSAQDAAFLRGLLLDLIGKPPTPLELQYYLADQEANKHEKLVEWVMKSDDYARHAATKWLTKAAPAAKGDDRLTQLLDRLLTEKKSDQQILEALTLATLGRYPTESETTFITAHAAKQKDRRTAWTNVLATLVKSGEAQRHVDGLRRRAEGM